MKCFSPGDIVNHQVTSGHDFMKRQAGAIERELSNLVTDDRGERDVFLSLAFDTFDAMPPAARRRARSWRMDPDSAACPSVSAAHRDRENLPADLQSRWEAWREAFEAMRERNPRLEIAGILEKISEAHDASSWPYGSETEIMEWVKADEYRPLPFDVRGLDGLPYLRARLAQLRGAAGGGWPYYSEESGRVVWVHSQP